MRLCLVAIGFIGFGWYQTRIKPLSKTVLRVEDTKVSLAHLERRMSLALEDISSPSQQVLLNLPDTVLDELEFEASMIQGAKEFDLEVTDEELALEIRDRGGLADDVDPGLYAAEVKRQVEDTGLKENEYRQMLRAELLQEKVRAFFLFVGPTEEPQVRYRWIILNDEADAADALQRVQSGESFAAVAQEISLDTASAEIGGEREWAPRGVSPFVPEEVDDVLFESEVGVLSEVINVSNLYYIVEVVERDDSRALDDAQRRDVAGREFGKWLTDVNGTLDIERNLTEEDAVRALRDVLPG